MKEFITARVVRPIAKRVRIYTTADIRRYKKLFGPHIQINPFGVLRGEESFVARVPVVMTTVPETPDIIIIGAESFIRVQESPLTYRRALSQKATRTK